MGAAYGTLRSPAYLVLKSLALLGEWTCCCKKKKLLPLFWKKRDVPAELMDTLRLKRM